MRAVPVISVVLETYTVSREYPAMQARAQLGAVLDSLRAQSYPKNRTETIVVFDESSAGLIPFVQERLPEARIVRLGNATYYSMKNHGFELAGGDICALIDGDCIPSADWLERIAGAFERGPDVVVGKTRYRPEHRFAQTFSVFDFGHVQAGREGKAFAFNLNNVAFHRTVFAHHRLDARARRNGACFLLWRKLSIAGCDMVYEPRAFAGHGDDYLGAGFLHKHLERGFDWINLLRTTDPGLLNGSGHMRLGPLVPAAMFIARVRFDVCRLVSNRRDLGIRMWEIPYYYAVSVLIRGLEAAGGILAVLKPDYFPASERELSGECAVMPDQRRTTSRAAP